MVDRTIVYPIEVPFDIDILQSQKNILLGFSEYISTVTGLSGYVNGLECVPSTPAALTVEIGPGSVYENSAVDSTPYGSLPATPLLIMQQGISYNDVTLSTPAPPTIGNSIKYLVQVSFAQTDGIPQNRTFFGQPSQIVNTQRQGLIDIGVKPGIEAPTGTEVAPSPDPGFIGLWVVTVAFGQTTVLSGDIAVYPGAPFIIEKLQDKISLTTALANFYTQAYIDANYYTQAFINANYYTQATTNASFVKVPNSPGSAIYIVRVEKTSDQVYVSPGAYTIIFDQVNQNINTWYNSGTGRITPTFPCTMCLTTSLDFNTTLGDAYILMGVNKNGGSLIGFQGIQLGGSFQTSGACATAIVEFDGVGDYAEVSISVGGVSVELFANSGSGAVFNAFIIANS